MQPQQRFQSKVSDLPLGKQGWEILCWAAVREAQRQQLQVWSYRQALGRSSLAHVMQSIKGSYCTTWAELTVRERAERVQIAEQKVIKHEVEAPPKGLFDFTPSCFLFFLHASLPPTAQYLVHQRNWQPVKIPLMPLQILPKHASRSGHSQILLAHPLPAPSPSTNLLVPHCVTLS